MRLLAAALAFAVVLGGAAAVTREEACGDRPQVEEAVTADGYCAFVYANVDTARSLAVDSAGNVLVVERGTGSLVLLTPGPSVDLAIEDVEKIVLIPERALNHAVIVDESDLALANGGPYIYVSSATDVYRYNYDLSARTASSEHLVVRDIPNGGHVTRTLAIDERGRLFVQCGSLHNIDENPDRSNIVIVSPAQINSGNLEWSSLEVFVDGLRNEVGLEFDSNGVLWGIENGADNLMRDDLGGDIHNDNPCEEINKLTEAGKFYGYPYCWSEGILDTGDGPRTQWAWPQDSFPADADTMTDAECSNDSMVVKPSYCLPAHWAPLGLRFQPPTTDSMQFPFPGNRAGDLIVLSHGSWNRDPPTGHAVARVKFDRRGGDPLQEPYELLFNGLETRRVRPVDGVFLEDGTFLFTSDATDEVIALRYFSGTGTSPSPETSASPSPTPDSGDTSGGDDAVCFPADAVVETVSGEMKRMDELHVGDIVRVSATEFSPVFAFGHRDPDAVTRHVELHVDDLVLCLTRSHLIPISGELKAAGTVQVGDRVQLKNGTEAAVTDIRTVTRMGLYNPHTMHGDIVVNGVRASTLTTTVPPKLARVILNVPKFLYHIGVPDPLFGLLDRNLPGFVYNALSILR